LPFKFWNSLNLSQQYISSYILHGFFYVLQKCVGTQCLLKTSDFSNELVVYFHLQMFVELNWFFIACVWVRRVGGVISSQIWFPLKSTILFKYLYRFPNFGTEITSFIQAVTFMSNYGYHMRHMWHRTTSDMVSCVTWCYMWHGVICDMVWYHLWHGTTCDDVTCR